MLLLWSGQRYKFDTLRGVMLDWQNCSGYRCCLFEAADFCIGASHFSLRCYEGERDGISLTLRV